MTKSSKYIRNSRLTHADYGFVAKVSGDTPKLTGTLVAIYGKQLDSLLTVTRLTNIG